MRRANALALGVAAALACAAAVGVRAPVMLPTGWAISPPGDVRAVGTMPVGVAISADGAIAVVSEEGAAPAGVRVLDARTLAVERFVDAKKAFVGSVWSAPKRRGPALSGRSGNVIFDARGPGFWMVVPAGDELMHVDAASGAIDEIVSLGAGTYPDDLASSVDGRELAVADDLSGSVSLVDVATGRVRGAVAVGADPYGLVWSRDGTTLYVTLWGGREVAVVDSSALVVRAKIEVGLHPEGIVGSRDGRYLYVANSDDDTLSVIDTHGARVVATADLGLFNRVAVGASPTALTLSSDGGRLYVACSNANAVAVFSVNGASLHLLGAVPTGWYPTSLALDGDQILIASGKGEGSSANPGFAPFPLSATKPADRTGYVATRLVGSVRRIAWPTEAELAAGLDEVRRNAGAILMAELGNPHIVRSGPSSDDAGRAIVRAGGPIRHVIYIIKENRTYDQVLGDVAGADGDSKLTLFGRKITPNQHAIAERFGIFDRTFADGQVSADGHNWSMAAIANDYVNKMWPPVYGDRRNRYDFGSGTGAAVPHNGYLWDDAARVGVSYRDYGEFADLDEPVGVAVTTKAPGLSQHVDPGYRGFDLAYADTRRVEEWLREFRAYVREGNLPALEIVWLPNDHTAGTKPGAWTPPAMVADNDEALGRIVDAVSHSPYWASTAIFAIEDDAQDGPDHVDDQRTTLYVASPYAASGVHHEHYTTASVLRTIELMLGLPPLSTYDAAALPLYAAFTPRPDLRPFDLVRETVDTRARNGLDGYRSLEAASFDWRHADAVPDATMNDLVWHAVRGGWATPPPYGVFPGRRDD